MKKLLSLIFLSVIIFSCGSDENDLETDLINIENISRFSVSISSPEKERDYTYHNEGNSGIFENPSLQTSFKSNVKIEYIDNTDPVPTSKIKIKWSSNIDGVIFEGNINNEFESNFEKSLSKGNHKIYFEASIDNNPNFIAKDSVILSNVISLQLEPTDRAVKLNWSKYLGDDFQSYLIYREDYEPIVEISDINNTQYEDTDITLADTKKFQVIVKTLNDDNIISGSNIEETEAGKYLKIPHFITKTIYDQTRNKIYSIVGENSSSNNATEYGLIILDNNSEKVEINSHILKEHRFSDLDMSSDGKYLFLCQKGVDKITRLDLNSLESTRFDVAYGGWGVHKIEVGNDYRLYCPRRPPTSGSSPMYILDGLTGEQVGLYNWMIHGDVEFNIYNNKLYHSTSVREKSVIKFSVNNDNVIREKTFSPDIWWPKSFILLSENGEHIFWEKFQLDKDLNIMREFENPIVACNSNSSYLSDGLKLMSFDDLNTIFKYPNFPNYEISGEIFTIDNALLFIKSSQPYTNERFTHFFKISTE